MSQETRVEPVGDAVARRRPILVWVICAWYAIAILVAIPAIFLATSGAIPLPPAAGTFYQSFGLLNYVGVLGSAVLAALAGITLFRMRRSAFAYATALFVLNVAKTIWYWPSLHAMGYGLGYQAFQMALSALLPLYVWRLWATGRLLPADQHRAGERSHVDRSAA